MSFGIDIVVFALSLLGGYLYKRSVRVHFPNMQKWHHGEILISGVGSVLWDVAFLFGIYLYLYQDMLADHLAVFLAPLLAMTLLGWWQDTKHVTPSPKISHSLIFISVWLAVMSWRGNVDMNLIEALLCLVFGIGCLSAFQRLVSDLWLGESMGLMLFLILAGVGWALPDPWIFLWARFGFAALLAMVILRRVYPELRLGQGGAHLLGGFLFYLGVKLGLNGVF